jgi:signal transduction histidine kinase
MNGISAKNTVFVIGFFRVLLGLSILLLAVLGLYDRYAEQAITTLKNRYDHMDQLRREIIHYDEAKDMSAKIASATGERKWKQQHQVYKEKLDQALAKTVALSPEVYRQGIDPSRQNYIQAIERLSMFLNKQMEAALEVERSKEYFTRVAFISVLILLLLSWLAILCLSRHSDRLSTAIADLQKAHQDLQNVQTQLWQSEKFSAIGQLAAGIAHEINNPIGCINSNLQTMEQYARIYQKLSIILNKLADGKPEAALGAVEEWKNLRTTTNFGFIETDVGNLLRESKEGAEKIRKIVLDLCTFASPDQGVMTSIDLEALLESVLNIVHNELKYRIRVVKDFRHGPFVRCQPQKIFQVFVNLLINATHSIKDSGTITIKTYFKDNAACVDISDTGCGISPEHARQIFDPFFTTKPPGQGTGLGLSVSYDIVRKHGGTITFNSRLGVGTTFTITLPLSDVEATVLPGRSS